MDCVEVAAREREAKVRVFLRVLRADLLALGVSSTEVGRLSVGQMIVRRDRAMRQMMSKRPESRRCLD